MQLRLSVLAACLQVAWAYGGEHHAHHHTHNYEITAFEAYLDMYILTGDQLYMDAMEGAWGMFRDHWIHVGGSIAMNEMRPYPPGTTGSVLGQLLGGGAFASSRLRWRPCK